MTRLLLLAAVLLLASAPGCVPVIIVLRVHVGPETHLAAAACPCGCAQEPEVKP